MKVHVYNFDLLQILKKIFPSSPRNFVRKSPNLKLPYNHISFHFNHKAHMVRVNSISIILYKHIYNNHINVSDKINALICYLYMRKIIFTCFSVLNMG